ncbi:pullulanase-type alpha-1,6-glucosidase, partial [Myxococcota bacterium]|nr:pullulanase-type alpha-1,6-glucosidase [Myxococcota bacterium]
MGLVLGALALALAACSSEDTPADSGVRPDATTPDSGVHPDAGETPDSGGNTLPPNAFLLHYHRPLADYAGWTVTLGGDTVEATASADPARATGFGAAYLFTKDDGASSITVTLTNGAETDPAGTLTIDVSGGLQEAWVFQGYTEALLAAPDGIPGPNQVVVYYGRPDNQYEGWGLHTWGDVETETLWSFPLGYAGIDPIFGAYYIIDVKEDAERINIIVHKGDTKDPGPDMGWNISELGDIVFVVSGSSQVFSVPKKAGVLAISDAKAHLLADGLLAWKVDDPEITSYELRYSATAEIAATETDIVGGTVVPLTLDAGGLAPAVLMAQPYLRDGFKAFTIAEADRAQIPAALKGQLVAVARKADGAPKAATLVQIPVILDALYTYEGPLGVTFTGRAPTFTLWAPTAQSVKLFLHDDAKTELESVEMTPGPQGTWTHTGDETWYGRYYRYQITVYHPVSQRIETTFVTDPYSVNVSTNGEYSQILDLRNDPALRPWGWDSMTKPALEAPEDIVIYESHIRDFSVTDETVPAAHRGKYLAFTATVGPGRSDGMTHLATLAQAGVTHLHLLPTFDIATVDEDASTRVDVSDPFQRLCEKNPSVPMELCVQFAGMTIEAAMASLPGDSETQQEIANHARGLDSFNWGYDPFHYGALEGSYATNPDGAAKIIEFRRMVKALADVGLRVVMDVVYNHTNASGLTTKSVLDKVVPGYYHRLNATTGFVESSTCCQNTATEHRMMERLMIDTLITFAVDYKVDAFRFDLMGHHMKVNMLRVRDTLAALNVAEHGVDGSKIFLYGEGWDFGEVQNNQRGVNATQLNMFDTRIGTFNDRLRDSVRGGSAFDSGAQLRENQGFASGLYLDPNEASAASDANKTKLNEAADRIKVGMAGNLRDFRLVKATGEVTNGGGVGYNGARTGYTNDPQETINYVSKHDNQTIFDIAQYKLPTGTSMADRVRVHNLSLAFVAYGQGVPFFHMGDDLLRSKSMERDSYDSGDWFNQVDWSGQRNNWKSGLPNAGKDAMNWSLIRTIFADASIDPTPSHIGAATAAFQEMMMVRKSSRLFRLTTKADVMSRVDFLNVGPSQIPGLIVMT